MASDLTKIKLGPCKVTFDVGGTSPIIFESTQGGVVLNYTENTRETNIDQYGDTPVKEHVTGRQASVEVPFAEYDLSKLAQLIPGSTLVGSAGSQRVDVSAVNVVDLYEFAKEVLIEPIDGTAEDAVTLYKAAPRTNISYTYDFNNERITNVTFKAYPDADNNLIGFGDQAATAV